MIWGLASGGEKSRSSFNGTGIIPRYLLVTVFLLILLVIGGFRAVYYKVFDVILESKDVQFFKVEEIQGSHPTRLKLSGLAMNSSMGVRKIAAKEDGSAVAVLVHLALANGRRSGSFAYELTIPDSVQEVRFGSSGTPVWRRRSP